MMLLSVPLAYTFASLARDYPNAAGVSWFAERAFGKLVGALIGWFYVAAAAVGQFIVALTGGSYVAYAFGLPRWGAFLIAFLLLVGAVTSNVFGLRTSGKVQLAVSGLVVAVLVVVIVAGISRTHVANLVPSEPLQHLRTVGTGCMMIFWSFFGWEAITSLAPEFRDARRDIVRATWGGLIVVGVLYIGIATVVIGTHAYTAGATAAQQAMNSAALAHVLGLGMGRIGEAATAMLALVICIGTTNAFVASVSRLAYALSETGTAPSWLRHMNKYAAPGRAVILVGGIAVMGLMVTYLCHLSLAALVYVPNSLGIATYVIGTAVGVRLLTTVRSKFGAVTACLLCLCAYPFVGTALSIPLLVAACCLTYLGLRKWRRVNR